MAEEPPSRDLVGDIPPRWLVPPTEEQINYLWQLNEMLDLPERYYPMIKEMLGTAVGVRRAIALFEKYGTPK